MKAKKLWSRRDFLTASALSVTSIAVAACAPKAAPTTAPTQAPKEEAKQAAQEATQAPEPTKAVAQEATLAPEAGTCQADWQPTFPQPPKKYDPVLVIDCAPCFYSAVYKDDETSEDNVWSRFTEEHMGLHFRRAWEFGTHQQHGQKLSVVMASGDLPDLMTAIGMSTFWEGMDGDYWEDITAAWESTASPLLKDKKEYSTDPKYPFWPRCSVDGRVYGLPLSNGGGDRLETVLWVRKDWLDKLGMQPPETLDDVYEVGHAFQEAKLCDVGFLCAGTLMYRGMGTADFVWGAHGTVQNKWLEDGKGGLIYGGMMPQAKEAIAVMRDWYAKNLLAKDFFTQVEWGPDGIPARIAAQKGGLFAGQAIAGGFVKPLNDTTVPEAELAFCDVPAHPQTGQHGRFSDDEEMLGYTTAFRKGMDPVKIEAFINHMNWLVERYVHRFDNQDYMVFEGYDWKWTEDCSEIVAGDYGTAGLGVGSADKPAFFYPGMTVDENTALAKVEAKGVDSMNAYEKFLTKNPYDKINRAAQMRLAETREWRINNQFLGRPGEKMKLYWGDCRKIETERVMAMIVGEAPMDDFEKMIADMNAAGADQVTAEVNEWYAQQPK